MYLDDISLPGSSLTNILFLINLNNELSLKRQPDNVSTIVTIPNNIVNTNHSYNCDDIFDTENVYTSIDNGVYCVLNPLF